MYDNKKDTSYIIYMDKNSLYPQAMSEHLPFVHMGKGKFGSYIVYINGKL